MSEIETNYEHAMRRLLSHSVTCLAEARREDRATALRSGSESHLAGTTAYALAELHDSDQGAADDVAVILNRWADDGEDLAGWVASCAFGMGIDVEALIAEAQTKPAPTPPACRFLSWDYREQPDLDALAAALRDLTGGTLHVVAIDTGGQDYAIALSTGPLTADEARGLWEASNER